MSAAAPDRRPLVMALVVALGCMANPANSTMIAAVYGSLMSEMGTDLASGSWLISIYLGVSAALQPLAGALGDRVGRKRTYVLGLLGFIIVSALATRASTLNELIVARSLQALCSSLVVPNGIAILGDGVAEGKRGMVLGILGAMMGLAAGLGLPIGAALFHHFGWQSLFWINVPLGAVALALAVWKLPEQRAERVSFSRVAWFGVALLPFALMLEGVHREDMGWLAALGAALTILSLTLAARAMLGDAASRGDGRRIATPAVASVMGFVVLQQTLTFGLMMVVPALLVGALGYREQSAAAAGGAMTMLVVLTSPAGGRMADQRGVRIPAGTGTVLAGLGMAMIVASVLWAGAWSQGAVLLGLVFIGLGFGIAGPSVMRAALDQAPPEVMGLVMGLFSSAQYLGRILGIFAFAAGVGARATHLDAAHATSLLVGMLLCALLPALLLIRWFPIRELPGAHGST